jgi:hypothetical protein
MVCPERCDKINTSKANTKPNKNKRLFKTKGENQK